MHYNPSDNYRCRNVVIKSLVDNFIEPMRQSEVPDFGPLAKALAGLVVVYIIGIAASYSYNRIMVNVGQGTLRTSVTTCSQTWKLFL